MLRVRRISFKKHSVKYNFRARQQFNQQLTAPSRWKMFCFFCLYYENGSRMHFPAYLCRTHTDLLKEWIGWCLEKSSIFKLHLEFMSCVKTCPLPRLLSCAKALNRGWKYFFKILEHTVQTCACVMTDSMCKSQHERTWQSRLKCFLACTDPCSSFFFFSKE